MGEALITRRGGGVKTATVTPTRTVLQSDILMGARNAVVVLAGEAGTPLDTQSSGGVTRGLVHALFIENGVLKTVTGASALGKTHYEATTYKLSDGTTKEYLVFDSVAGQIKTESGTSQRWIFEGDTGIAPYKCYVWD